MRVCNLALVIRHENRIFSAPYLLSVACLAVSHFFTSSHIRHDFRGKKFTENKMCILIFSKNVWNNFFRSKKNAERYHKFIYVFL